MGGDRCGRRLTIRRQKILEIDFHSAGCCMEGRGDRDKASPLTGWIKYFTFACGFIDSSTGFFGSEILKEISGLFEDGDQSTAPLLNS